MLVHALIRSPQEIEDRYWMDIQLPALPTIVLSLVTCTLAAPLMAPCTTTTLAPSALAAAESWGSVLTVVVDPPAPPLVLVNHFSVMSLAVKMCALLPSVLCSIADVGSISDSCSLGQHLCSIFVKCRGWRC